MRELIVPPLMINLFMFIIGTVMGINPELVTLSIAGGFVFQLQLSYSIIGTTLAAVIIAAAFIGVKVLGSGFSDTSVAMFNLIIVYALTWAILSSVTYAFLWQIPVFGILIYATLSILYAFGVFLQASQIGGGDGGQQTQGKDE